MSNTETKNKGAVKGGNGSYIFDLAGLQRMEAGVGYSSAEGPVVEGERIQVGLISMKRGTGARAHAHPNEQWIYLIKGKARASVDGQPERIVGPGTLIYLPANIVHYMQALPTKTSSSSPARTCRTGSWARPRTARWRGPMSIRGLP